MLQNGDGRPAPVLITVDFAEVSGAGRYFVRFLNKQPTFSPFRTGSVKWRSRKLIGLQ